MPDGRGRPLPSHAGESTLHDRNLVVQLVVVLAVEIFIDFLVDVVDPLNVRGCCIVVLL